VYHVIEGRGQSRVGETQLAWAPGDTFVAPPWHFTDHANGGDGPACLFQFNDEPVLRALALLQEESR
jgi:gentisate 1,2-dioxygenase